MSLKKFLFLVFLYQLLVLLSFNDGVLCNQTNEQTKYSNNTPRIGQTEDENEYPMETQSAQCTITAGEVRASAQASTTKKLEGVCGSKEMKKAFENLESKMMRELHVIKLMIAQLQYPNLNILPNYLETLEREHAAYQTTNKPPTTTESTKKPIPTNITTTNITNIQQTTNTKPTVITTKTTTPVPTTTRKPIDPNRSLTDEDYFVFPSEEDSTEESTRISTTTSKPKTYIPRPTTKPRVYFHHKSLNFNTIQSPIVTANRFEFNDREISMTTEKIITTTSTSSITPLKQLQSRQQEPDSSESNGPRDFEIHRFNNTIIKNDDTQIFTYFWKIENLTSKYNSNVTEISSPIFTISGLHLRVRAILNHLNRDYLYLKIESVPYETMIREKSPNFILKSGDIFKEIETKKLFRHKIILLDQSNSIQTDMISQEFFNTNSGFMIPTTAITSNTYFKDESILIKVIIYL